MNNYVKPCIVFLIFKLIENVLEITQQSKRVRGHSLQKLPEACTQSSNAFGPFLNIEHIQIIFSYSSIPRRFLTH